MTDLLRRDALLQVKVETNLVRAAEAAARSRGQTVSEFVRQSMRAQIATQGGLLGDDSGPDRPAPAAALRSAA